MILFEIGDPDVLVGDHVITNIDRSGDVRWIGIVTEDDGTKMRYAGVVLNTQYQGDSDGKFRGKQKFIVQPGHATFIPILQQFVVSHIKQEKLERLIEDIQVGFTVDTSDGRRGTYLLAL